MIGWMNLEKGVAVSDVSKISYKTPTTAQKYQHAIMVMPNECMVSYQKVAGSVHYN